MNKNKSILLFVLTGLPLIIYPIVFIADLMSLAAHSSSNGSMALNIAVTGFQLTSLAYPVVYIACLILYINKRNKIFVYFPVIYIGIITLFFLLWSFLDK